MDRPDPLALALAELRGDARLGPHLALDHTLDAREGAFSDLPEDLPPGIREGLAARGISRLYAHQAEAMEHVHASRHVVLATPTASGKSLCFHLPVLQGVRADPNARALFVFPTKALGQDQVSALLDLSERSKIPLKVHTFDGDTPSSVRTLVRREAQVVVTNPDMLHQGILPHHPRWMSFFRNLRWIVLDELHTYRGVFGSQVANVLRRLTRICRFYGSRPTYITGSATIANPRELAHALTGLPFELVDHSGAPVGPRRLLVATPPVVNRALGIRRSYILFARELLRPFLRRRVPTIVFGLSRLNVEVLVKYIRDDLRELRLDPDLVQGYRGGYLPGARRRIERGLRDGSVRFVVSTNALELGIDVGALQACVVVGYPGSMASFWQQAGRAGRRRETAAVVYIPRSNPLDQYVATEPDYLLGAQPEEARINPDNLIILSEHLKCAAFELPFDAGETFGGLDPATTEELLETLAGFRVLHRSQGRYHWSDRTYPANHVSLRSIPGDNFVVVDHERDRLLAEVDFKSAHTTLFVGAIYNLQGEQYEVLRLDYEGHKAFVRKVRPDYYTDAMTYSEVRPLEAEAVADLGAYRIERGDVKVSEKVVGFKKIRFGTNENVGHGPVDLPELTFHTAGAWLILTGKALARVSEDAAREEARRRGAPIGAEDVALDVLAGLSHALHHMAVLHTLCDPRDLGRCVGDRTEQGFARLSDTSQSSALRGRRRRTGMRPFDFDPAIFLYDTYPGGIGISERVAPALPLLLQRARLLIGRCPCEGGCPSCLGAFASPSASLKRATTLLLDHILASDPEREAASA